MNRKERSYTICLRMNLLWIIEFWYQIIEIYLLRVIEIEYSNTEIGISYQFHSTRASLIIMIMNRIRFFLSRKLEFRLDSGIRMNYCTNN